MPKQFSENQSASEQISRSILRYGNYAVGFLAAIGALGFACLFPVHY